MLFWFFFLVIIASVYLGYVVHVMLKDCTFRIVFTTWFKWDSAEGKKEELDFVEPGVFRIYNGNINRLDTVKDYHKGGENYQEIRVDATVSKSFNTARFPLGSHVLQFYVEPNYTIDKVVLVPDKEHSGVNSNLSISGYSLMNHAVGGHTVRYPNTMNNPTFTEPAITSETVTALEMNRDSLGLYMKCFIALLGTMAWILITVYICANHRVNPLGTIPAALFGTVGNIMVGANLLPDVVQLGLVEYVNLYGIMILLAEE